MILSIDALVEATVNTGWPVLCVESGLWLLCPPKWCLRAHFPSLMPNPVVEKRSRGGSNCDVLTAPPPYCRRWQAYKEAMGGADRLALAYDSRTIRVYDCASGEMVASLEGHTDQVRPTDIGPWGEFVGGFTAQSIQPSPQPSLTRARPPYTTPGRCSAWRRT
jgi:hypothetical protein